MRKVLLLFLLMMSFDIFSQIHIKENSFHEIVGYVMLDRNDHYDDNNLPMALIKISTENISAEERSRIKFKGNMETYFDPVFDVGEICLYLSTAATFIEIIHPDYGKTEYNLPVTLKPHTGYEMVLVSDYFSDKNNIPEVNYLTVKTEQKNAMIFIDDEFVGLNSVTKLLDVGKEYSWRIECERYYPENGKIYLSHGEPYVLDTTLQRNYYADDGMSPSEDYGFVRVVTTPESGADVYIDCKHVGKTPYLSGRIKTGKHKMVVVHDSYKPSNEEFIVTDKNTTTLNVGMKSNVANITVVTDSLSNIYIDNEEKGVGRWSGKISYGSHAIEARKPSHKTTFYYINADGKNNDVIHLPDPEPIYGFLSIGSVPQGADIYLDSNYYSKKTPVVEKLLVGEYEVRLQKEGYATSIKKVVVRENETLTLNEKLIEGKKIRIETDRAGDKIYVDRNYIGKSPQHFDMSYGIHTITIERDGFVVEEEFYVQQDGKSEIKMFFGKEVTIDTDHKGDVIYVDGVEVGKSPCVVKLSYGNHDISAERGMLKINKIVTLDRYDKVDRITINLGKNVTINTFDEKENVYIQDKYVGKSPVRKYLTFGEYEVKIADGEREATKVIQVKDDGQSEFTIYYGQLVRFDSDKNGDAVFVNGKKEGRTPLELDLVTGNHEVMVKRNRKRDVKDVYITRGGKSDYIFFPTKETIAEFNSDGVRFLTVNAASGLEIFDKNVTDLTKKLSYGLSYGSYRKFGWYMSVMTNFDVTDSTCYTGITQFLPGFVSNNSVIDYNEFNGNTVNSKLSATLGIMFIIFDPVYLKLGGGYQLQSKYYHIEGGEWRKLSDAYSGYLLNVGLQFNMKHFILSTEVLTNPDFNMLELKVGLGFGWRKNR